MNATCLGQQQYIIKLSNDANPSASGDLAEVEPGKATTTLRATVYDSNNQPVSKAVELTVKAEPNTGGHDHHDSTRLPGTLSPASGTSPLTFSFTAPAPAGDHTITAKCVDGSCGEATGKVWVGVKELVALYDTHLYTLVGSDAVHPINHYLTASATGKIVWLAQLYRERFPSELPPHLNDGSLERGGLFDIQHSGRGTTWWTPPHSEHRRGTVIDVRANQAVGAIPSWNHRVFLELVRDIGADAGLHSPGTANQHFHVRLMGVAE